MRHKSTHESNRSIPSRNSTTEVSISAVTCAIYSIALPIPFTFEEGKICRLWKVSSKVCSKIYISRFKFLYGNTLSRYASYVEMPTEPNLSHFYYRNKLASRSPTHACERTLINVYTMFPMTSVEQLGRFWKYAGNHTVRINRV